MHTIYSHLPCHNRRDGQRIWFVPEDMNQYNRTTSEWQRKWQSDIGLSCFQWQSLLAGLLNFLSERVPEPKLQSQLGLWVGWRSKLNWKWQSVVSRYYGQESFPADARRYISNKRRAALFLYLKHCSIPRNVNNLSDQPH